MELSLSPPHQPTRALPRRRGTLVTIGHPHDTSWSPRARNRQQHHPWCCSFYGSGRTHTPLQYHTESRTRPGNPLCSASSSSPEPCQPALSHGSACSRRPWGWDCTAHSLSPSASSTLPFSPVDLFLISPISRLQMRTPRHRELRRPVQCHTDGEWQSSDSSPGSPAPGDAPGSRAYCGHPGPNPPWRPDRGPAARHPGRERGWAFIPPRAPRLSHLSQATGQDDIGSRPRPLSTAPGRSPRLHEEAGVAPGRGGWPGPRRQLPSRAGESPGGPAGRERWSGLPGPAAPQQDARMPAEAPWQW